MVERQSDFFSNHHTLHPGNTAPFEEMSQRWRVVGNTVFHLTGPRFEPQTIRSRDERVTARPTGRFFYCKLFLLAQWNKSHDHMQADSKKNIVCLKCALIYDFWSDLIQQEV